MMKEIDGFTLTDNKEYIKSSNGFQQHDEIEDDDIVIIQLIVQGRSITVCEYLLAKYSKYFWNLFQNLPPLPEKILEPANVNGNIGNTFKNG